MAKKSQKKQSKPAKAKQYFVEPMIEGFARSNSVADNFIGAPEEACHIRDQNGKLRRVWRCNDISDMKRLLQSEDHTHGKFNCYEGDEHRIRYIGHVLPFWKDKKKKEKEMMGTIVLPQPRPVNENTVIKEDKLPF